MSYSGPPKEKKDPSLVDGKDFLQHLRNAGNFESNNIDATVGASNTSTPRQNLGNVSELFQRDEASTTGDKSPPIDSLPVAANKSASPKQSYMTSPDQHQHSRSVSWGVNNTEYYDDDISSLDTGYQRKLTAEDLMRSGPFVEEAEFNIIRAIEKE